MGAMQGIVFKTASIWWRYPYEADCALNKRLRTTVHINVLGKSLIIIFIEIQYDEWNIKVKSDIKNGRTISQFYFIS